MEVAVPMNDSQSLSPSLQPRSHSRYSTPDTPNARSPNRREPSTTLPIAPAQEPPATLTPSLIASQNHSQATRLPLDMNTEGQNHDRMDTDDASQSSSSDEALPQHDEILISESSVPAIPAVPDVEAMDTTPDGPAAEEVGQPMSPQHQSQQPHDPQDMEGVPGVLHNLVRINSRGSTVGSNSPTEPFPRTDAPDPLTSTVLDPQTSQPTDIAHSAQSATPTPPPAQTASSIQPPTEQEEERRVGQDDDSPDEDSADEEEHPYWSSFEADKSVPSEDELKLMEQDSSEISALDHERWMNMVYEPLDDPEYVITASGRIEWTLKGFHGSAEKPNKETVMRSPSVSIGGYYWNIKLYPRGNENTDSMSVYLECSTSPKAPESKESDKGEAESATTILPAAPEAVAHRENQPNVDTAAQAPSSAIVSSEGDQSKEPPEPVESSPNVDMEDMSEEQAWEVPAQVLCIAYNPEEPRVHAYQKVTHRFSKDTADWGWTRFHGPWDRLHRRERLQRRAMLQNDTLSFTAYIRTVQDDTGALWWHAPANRPEWDSFERLGLNRLWVGSPDSSAVLCTISTWLHLTPLCRSIQNMAYPERLGMRMGSHRPLHEELERVRFQLTRPLKESDEALSLINIAEILDWNDAGDCEPDVVSNFDLLRRTLSYEALGNHQIADMRDIFDDILLLRQPYDAPTGLSGPVSHSQQHTTDEPISVQEALDAAVARGFKLEAPPAVLQIELHRQNYDVSARKWKKLTHRIAVDQNITLELQGSSRVSYTLFGMTIHSGDLESKDYYNVVRPQGRGTRWIKYSGDKSTKGIECLTTKQAVEAHEGGDDVGSTAAVAYVVTYVKSELLLSQSSEPTTAATAAGQDTNARDSREDLDDGIQVPTYIYRSSNLKGHHGLGVADWGLMEGDNSPLLKLDVPKSITLSDLVDAIDNARRTADADATGKYALWFLDTVKGNAAMQNVVRAPEIIPLSVRGPDSQLQDSHNFHRVCRIWLDDDTPELPEPTRVRSPPPDEPVPETANPEDTMQVDEDEDSTANDAAAATDENLETSANSAPAETQASHVDGGDTIMGGNPDPDAIQGERPIIARREWNVNLNTKVLGSFNDVFVFLKVFCAERQTLVGVTTLWVKQNDKVGYTVRQALSWEDDLPIDIYQEHSLSTLEEVGSGYSYQDFAGASNYILVVQKKLNEKEKTGLDAMGKPKTILDFFSYQCSACDPAYLQSHLKRSYFASPYFSGDIAYGRPHGQGISITTLGDAYTGAFISGSKSGQGKMRFANGDTYTGSWEDNDPNGQGEMVYAKTGNVYTGGFKKRKRHGKGIMKFEVADEEEHLCGICYEEEMDCCFYDCGHVAACEGCARQVDVCPVCRRGVKAVVRIWRS